MIELKKVVGGYNEKIVIQNVSLEINEAEFLGIIGPNGAGKSTLLKLICGIISLYDGEIFIDGKSIKKYNKKELAQKIAFLSQQSSFTLPFKCLDIVLMGRYTYSGFFESKKDYEIAKKIMQDIEVYELKDKFINEISGGELQMIRIARALVQEPKILLLDEPTTHLDLNHQIKIFDTLKRLNANGLTIIVASHELNIISAYVKKILLLNKGGVVKIGSPIEVMKKEIIEKVYDTEVIIEKHPTFNTPIVIFDKSNVC